MTVPEMVERYGIFLAGDMLMLKNTEILRDDDMIAEVLSKKEEIGEYLRGIQ